MITRNAESAVLRQKKSLLSEKFLFRGREHRFVLPPQIRLFLTAQALSTKMCIRDSPHTVLSAPFRNSAALQAAAAAFSVRFRRYPSDVYKRQYFRFMEFLCITWYTQTSSKIIRYKGDGNMSQSLYSVVDKDTLHNIVEAFYGCIKLPIQVIDEDGNFLESFGDTGKFCSFFQKHLPPEDTCPKMHVGASKRAISLGEPYIFSCHAHLNHIVYPPVSYTHLLGAPQPFSHKFFIAPGRNGHLSQIGKPA